MFKLGRNIFKSEDGFTLVELMIVFGVLGVLAAFIFPNVTGIIADAERGRVEGELSAIRSQAQSYVARYAGNDDVPNSDGYTYDDDDDWNGENGEAPQFQGLKDTVEDMADEYEIGDGEGDGEVELDFDEDGFVSATIVFDDEFDEDVVIRSDGEIEWGESPWDDDD